MKRLLYHISKTDRDLVERCIGETRMHQRSLGFFVLLTALFAFISSYYALSTIFGEWNYLSMQYELTIKQSIMATSCALLYALMIGSIDREIVSAKSKSSAILRIPLAIIIGIIISVPIELKILEDRINQKIQENHSEKMMPYKIQKDEFINSTNQEVSDIEVQIAYYTKKKLQAAERAAKEDMGISGNGLTGMVGTGKHWQYAKQEERNYSNEISNLERQKREKLSYREDRIKQLDRDFTIYKTDAVFGLWEKYLVMHQIIEEDETNRAKIMAYGISILFILLEVIPSLIKILSSKNEYDLILEFKYKSTLKRFEKALEEDDDEDIYDFMNIPEIRVA